MTARAYARNTVRERVRRALEPRVKYRRQSHSAVCMGASILVLSIILVTTAWAYVPAYLGLNLVMFPPPSKIWEAFLELIQSSPESHIGYYTFKWGGTIWTYLWTTFFSVSLSVIIGVAISIPLGIWLASRIALVPLIVFWLIMYYGGVPRLLEILMLNYFGIIGRPACVILGSLAIAYTTTFAVAAALQDEDLNDQVSYAQLDTDSVSIIAFGISIPQKIRLIAVGPLVGVVGANNTIIYTEYIQATPGLGYLLRIAFGNDPYIAEAFAVAILITGVLMFWCAAIVLAARRSIAFWMFLANAVIVLSRPRHC